MHELMRCLPACPAQQRVLEGRSTRGFAERVEWLSRLSYLRGINAGYLEVLAHLFQEVVSG
jgi:hypothetical protein